MKLAVRTIGFLVLLTATASAESGVDSKSGNMFVSYSDIHIQAPLEVLRTYNSKTTQVGLFGFGWNTKIETYLLIDPSGLPVLHQHGSGARQQFKPAQQDSPYEDTLELSIRAMQDALLEERLGTAEMEDRKSVLADITKELENPQKRLKYWKRLVEQGKVNTPVIPVGAQFVHSCTCSFVRGQLLRTPEGFRYTAPDNIMQFDEDGVLLSITHKGRTLLIERYDSGPHAGRISLIKHNEQDIQFFYNEFGQVIRLLHQQSGRDAVYRYDEENLVYSRDAENNVYGYSYDLLHNLTRIEYDDGTTFDVQYEDETNFVSQVKDRSGAVTRYKYGFLEGDSALNYFTEIVQMPAPGEAGTAQHERREYYHHRSAYGMLPVRGVSEADGVRRESIYDDQGVLKQIKETSTFTPREIVTDFSFDAAGRVTDLSSDSWRRQYIYADDSSSRIRRLSTHYGIEYGEFVFDYDDFDRLIVARHAGHEIKVSYKDDQSSVVVALEKGRQKLMLAHDNFGRIIRIVLNDGSESTSLDIKYDQSGNPLVDVSAPMDVFYVTGVLSGMLQAISPAGITVDLSLH